MRPSQRRSHPPWWRNRAQHARAGPDALPLKTHLQLLRACRSGCARPPPHLDPKYCSSECEQRNLRAIVIVSSHWPNGIR